MATDYVLRVLYARLSRAFNALATDVSAISNSYTVPTYDTVADMLSAEPSTITSFARCNNYSGTDGVKSMWLRSGSGPDNGSDIRESTFLAGIFYERFWSSDGL